MDWREDGILLARRRHGEHAAIIDVFTRNHGRHAGIVRGGASRKMTPVLEPGNQVDVTWRARLEDHLGTFTVEPIEARAAALMSDRLTLAGLNALSSLLIFALPEREPHANLYDGTLTVLGLMASSPHWPLAYLRWGNGAPRRSRLRPRSLDLRGHGQHGKPRLCVTQKRPRGLGSGGRPVEIQTPASDTRDDRRGYRERHHRRPAHHGPLSGNPPRPRPR